MVDEEAGEVEEVGLDDHGFGGIGVFGDEAVGGEFGGDVVGGLQGLRRFVGGYSLGEALGDPEGDRGRVWKVQGQLEESGHLGYGYAVSRPLGARRAAEGPGRDGPVRARRIMKRERSQHPRRLGPTVNRPGRAVSLASLGVASGLRANFMYQQPLSEEYTQLSDTELDLRIRAAKAALGDDLVVLGHHYQRDEIIAHADYRGDSYKLAKDAGRHPDAKFIVFCGVHFMAESADILTGDDQVVILPNLAAGCSMADMANDFQVKACWKQLTEVLGDIELGGPGGEFAVVPVTYINSAANLKAFVGEHGGTVCTSTNAPAALDWAFRQVPAGVKPKILFFPDQHLGRNTGATMGYDPEADMVVWDPFRPYGGNTPERLRDATFILWKGHCSVHKRFTVEQVAAARAAHPGVNILVHPECPIEVVRVADFNGSTEYIIQKVEAAESGSAWAIGTEVNLVNRLAKEHPDKTVFCLDPQICPCSTMYRIHPTFLCWVLERLVAGEVVNRVKVPEATAQWAKVALARMLEIGTVVRD